jgi:hypothetical protein
MGLGFSLFLIAVGAVLALAIEVEESSGFDINAIGVILMVVGGLGILVSLLFWSSWGGFGRRDDVVVERGTRRTTVVEE